MYSLDSHKLHLHPGRVAAWQNDQVIYPLTVEISSTNACNQNCIFCAFDYRRSCAYLNHQELHKLAIGIGMFMEYGTQSVHFGGEGEPLLNVYLKETIRHLHAERIHIGVTTNGTCKNTTDLLPYLSWLRFSVNASTPELYQKIHGVDGKHIEEIYTTIEACVKRKKEKSLPTTIGVQCLWLQDNDHDIDVLARKVKDLGVDYFSLKPYSHHPQSKRSLPITRMQSAERIGRLLGPLRTDTFEPSIRLNAVCDTREKKDYTHCPAASFFAFVAADGGVYPCAQYVGNHDFCFGNIRLQTWREVMFSTRRHTILGYLRYEHDTTTCRQPCRLNEANRYLHNLSNLRGEDFFL